MGWVTIFEYSNSQFNYRISIRLCDYFLKVYPHWVFWTIPEPRLSPKALFLWVKWSLRDALGRGLFSRPWLGCKRWARVRFIWTLARHTYSVSANRAGARNFWYVHPDCVNNRSVKPIYSERAVCLSIKKQLKIINHKVNKTMHSPELSKSAFSATFTCYRKHPVSHLWSRDELAALSFFCWINISSTGW